MSKNKAVSRNIIEGLVVPNDWGEQGKVIGIAIHTDRKELYLVAHNRMEAELLNHLHVKVGIQGKIMERLDSSHLEQRYASFVQVGYSQGDALVGYRVAVQVEPHAQMFGEPIRGIKRPDRIAAGYQHNSLISEFRRSEQILLRLQRIHRRSKSCVPIL